MKIRFRLMGAEGVRDSGPIEIQPGEVFDLTVFVEGRERKLGEVMVIDDDPTAAGIDEFMDGLLTAANRDGTAPDHTS